MIRQYTNHDREEVLSIINKEMKLEQGDLDLILDHSNKFLLYEKDGRIMGLCSFRIWGKEEKKNVDLYTYVIPSERRQGIATLLIEHIWKNRKKEKYQFISTRIETNAEESIHFYTEKGYEKWYTDLILDYQGGQQPEPNISWIKYEDEYCEAYIQGLRNCFYELRKASDFKPYYCCELNEQKRKELLTNKDDIYLMMDQGSLIGSVYITSNGTLDNVFILPEYQGKGYGRKLMQFAINEALRLGHKKIDLCAVEWNVRALNLYDSLGFVREHASQYYRYFLSK